MLEGEDVFMYAAAAAACFLNEVRRNFHYAVVFNFTEVRRQIERIAVPHLCSCFEILRETKKKLKIF